MGTSPARFIGTDQTDTGVWVSVLGGLDQKPGYTTARHMAAWPALPIIWANVCRVRRHSPRRSPWSLLFIHLYPIPGAPGFRKDKQAHVETHADIPRRSPLDPFRLLSSLFPTAQTSFYVHHPALDLGLLRLFCISRSRKRSLSSTIGNPHPRTSDFLVPRGTHTKLRSPFSASSVTVHCRLFVPLRLASRRSSRRTSPYWLHNSHHPTRGPQGLRIPGVASCKLQDGSGCACKAPLCRLAFVGTQLRQRLHNRPSHPPISKAAEAPDQTACCSLLGQETHTACVKEGRGATARHVGFESRTNQEQTSPHRLFNVSDQTFKGQFSP